MVIDMETKVIDLQVIGGKVDLKEFRIVVEKTISQTKIFINNKEAKGIKSIRLDLDMDKHIPRLIMEVYPLIFKLEDYPSELEEVLY